jgi:RsiW-degrading membrane proteinase PrsW (M82 family)
MLQTPTPAIINPASANLFLSSRGPAVQNLAFPVLAAVVPSLLLLWYFYSRDVNPEPRRVLLVTFLLGVASVVPVLLVAAPLLVFVVEPVFIRVDSPSDLQAGLAQAFLTAAAPEEFFKWLVLVLYCMPHKEFDEPMDGVVYGAVASLGFATLENVFYVTWADDPWDKVAIVRAFTSVPCHAFLGAIMGYFVARAKFGKGGRRWNLGLALALPILLHGLYDLPMMILDFKWRKDNSFDMGWVAMAFGVLVVLGAWTAYLVRTLREEQLRQKGDPSTMPTI